MNTMSPPAARNVERLSIELTRALRAGDPAEAGALARAMAGVGMNTLGIREDVIPEGCKYAWNQVSRVRNGMPISEARVTADGYTLRCEAGARICGDYNQLRVAIVIKSIIGWDRTLLYEILDDQSLDWPGVRALAERRLDEVVARGFDDLVTDRGLAAKLAHIRQKENPVKVSPPMRYRPSGLYGFRSKRR